MEREKSILETSEVLQEVLSDFKEENFLSIFKISSCKAGMFFDLFWEQSKKNAAFCSVFNAFARMKFIEQFLKDAEVIMSDAIRFRLRDYYKDAAVELANKLMEEGLSEFVSESDLKKESESRFKRMLDEVGDSKMDEIIKEADAELKRSVKKHKHGS